MANYNLKINGKTLKTEVSPDTPLLWVLRDNLGLLGTKYGCGMAQCGACTVHINGEATRSCVLPVSAVADATITTIEGLSEKATILYKEHGMPSTFHNVVTVRLDK